MRFSSADAPSSSVPKRSSPYPFRSRLGFLTRSHDDAGDRDAAALVAVALDALCLAA
jgi:hypothetical protein